LKSIVYLTPHFAVDPDHDAQPHLFQFDCLVTQHDLVA
jgi:hypothetical protein